MDKFDLFKESHIVRRVVFYPNFKNQQSVFLVLRSKEAEDDQQKAKNKSQRG